MRRRIRRYLCGAGQTGHTESAKGAPPLRMERTIGGFPLRSYTLTGASAEGRNPVSNAPVPMGQVGVPVENLSLTPSLTVRKSILSAVALKEAAYRERIVLTVSMYVEPADGVSDGGIVIYLYRRGEERRRLAIPVPGEGMYITEEITLEGAAPETLYLYTGRVEYRVSDLQVYAGRAVDIGRYRIHFSVTDGEGRDASAGAMVLDEPLRLVSDEYTDRLDSAAGTVLRQVAERRLDDSGPSFWMYTSSLGSENPCFSLSLPGRAVKTPVLSTHFAEVSDGSAERLLNGKIEGVWGHNSPTYADRIYFSISLDTLRHYTISLDGRSEQESLPDPSNSMKIFPVAEVGVYRIPAVDGGVDFALPLRADLHGIDEIHDRITVDRTRGIATETRRIGVLELTGEETITYTACGANISFCLEGDYGQQDGEEGAATLCTHLLSDQDGALLQPETATAPCCYMGAEGFYITMTGDSPYADPDALRAWIRERFEAGDPITVCYALLSPRTDTWALERSEEAFLLLPTGASGDWYTDKDLILEGARAYLRGVAEAGMPVFLRYVLQDAEQTEESISAPPLRAAEGTTVLTVSDGALPSEMTFSAYVWETRGEEEST